MTHQILENMIDNSIKYIVYNVVHHYIYTYMCMCICIYIYICYNTSYVGEGNKGRGTLVLDHAGRLRPSPPVWGRRSGDTGGGAGGDDDQLLQHQGRGCLAALAAPRERCNLDSGEGSGFWVGVVASTER